MVTAGRPLVLCEYREGDLIDLPPHSINVIAYDFQHLDLAYCRVQLRNVQVGAWLLRTGAKVDPDELRRLRLNLFRVHQETESIRLLLRQVIRGNLQFEGESSDRLQEFLSRVIRVLESKSRFGITQAPLLDAAREVSGLVEPGQRTLLLESITRIRSTVRNKIERQLQSGAPSQIVNVIDHVETLTMTKVVLGNNATINGPFNVVTADTIQNSFNSIAKSDASDELKQRLQELTVQVTELAKHLPSEQAENVARDLEAFAKEATAAAPRKKWYELSASGLVEAAKAVAGMAGPVTSAVKAVIALLG
jgi:regulator of replication initiation timing